MAPPLVRAMVVIVLKKVYIYITNWSLLLLAPSLLYLSVLCDWTHNYIYVHPKAKCLLGMSSRGKLSIHVVACIVTGEWHGTSAARPAPATDMGWMDDATTQSDEPAMVPQEQTRRRGASMILFDTFLCQNIKKIFCIRRTFVSFRHCMTRAITYKKERGIYLLIKQ